MSKRNKLQKFADLLQFPNVYEHVDLESDTLLGGGGQPLHLAGKWGSRVFQNDRPLTLELACGRGEYSLELARRHPDRNFIGVDIKGARLWKGARTALQEALPNVAFLRIRIEHIARFFSLGEVDEIWITFPDPFLKKSKANRRLTSPRFLDTYRRFLLPGGLVHLKTDNDLLYTYSKEVLSNDPAAELLYADENIYDRPLPWPELDIKTYYEHQHLAKGLTIKYLRFALR